MHPPADRPCDLGVSDYSLNQMQSVVWLKKHLLSGQVKSSTNGLNWEDVTKGGPLFDAWCFSAEAESFSEILILHYVVFNFNAGSFLPVSGIGWHVHALLCMQP